MITGDESWVSIREIESKQFSLEWIPKGSPGLRPVKAKRQRSAKKLMLTVFFDCDGPVLIDFLPPKETVDTDQYLRVLNLLKDQIRLKRPALWKKPDPAKPERNFIIHQDNAPSHTCAQTLAFFLDIPLLAHPPYSPDLAPCDFFLFPCLKSQLACLQIRNLEELKVAVKKELKAIPKEDYCAALRQIVVRWMKCVTANRSYFEGRHFPVDPADFRLEVLFQYPDGAADLESDA